MSRLISYDFKRDVKGEYYLTFKVTEGTKVEYSVDRAGVNLVTLSDGKGHQDNAQQYFPNSEGQVQIAFVGAEGDDDDIMSREDSGSRRPKIDVYI